MNSNAKVRKILILAANPKETKNLNLAEEVRDIKEALQLARYRDQFLIEQEWAVRPKDIRRAILDFRPNIIHFCGHGVGTQGLCFQNNVGNLQFVTGEVLADLFNNFATQIECVLLNACYSEVQANAIVQHINYVIGMNAPINDKPAIEFTVGFYDGLAGYDPEQDKVSPVEFAFNLGCNAIGLAGLSANAIPVLKKNPNFENRIINPLVIKPRTNNIQISGRTKIFICQRLTQDWQVLADYFEIQPHELAGFKPGREPQSIWEWLEQRNRLGELESALIDIKRGDLAEELKKN
ncbi:MAG: CHAT domain-containing protein [Nostoc sp. NMS7]|uniref:CHAT domain-containing protein n=1 Tax=Nostoc sp. NMS7 TaxID=2815391 RepID=UPI0025E91B2B|nr:CHAT domain-containing protein [Nostoc sp. NMS7]MBN3945108.1 CHAT domain-containing protein [Nostoc sp. NMS7]